MNQLPLVALLCGAVSGAVSGAVTISMLGSGNGESTVVDPTATQLDSPSDFQGLARELREGQRELSDRIGMLESRPVAAVREAVPMDVDTTDEELLEEMRRMLASMKAPAEALDPNFIASVDVAMQQIREEEERIRREERVARDAERLEERLTSLNEKLGLDNFQANELRNALTDEMIRRNELMASADGDWGSMREGFGEIRDETREALESFLSEEQYDQYRQESRGFGRGGGFGGGGDRGGDRGGDNGGGQRGGGQRGGGGV